MEDRETARMRKYGKSKTTRIIMATVPHVTSGLGLRKFQTDGFLLTRVYKTTETGVSGTGRRKFKVHPLRPKMAADIYSFFNL